MEYRKEGYRISTDPADLDIEVIHQFLTNCYWSKGIPKSIIETAIRNSLCFGVFEGSSQIGFARVISDYATFAYLADVFILEEHRGKGLSKWLMECIMSHPDLQGLRRWVLATRDAHGLYEKYGFQSLKWPERFMEILDLEIYHKRRGDTEN